MLFQTLLWNAGTVAGARVAFQQFVTGLVAVQFPEANEVAGPGGGDWGIDTYVGRFGDSIEVWQSKFFLDWKGDDQRRQVRRSLRRLLTSARNEGFTVTTWTLCVPCVLPPAEQQWFDNWTAEQERGYPLTIQLWNGVRLRRLLERDDAEPLRRRFFTFPPQPAPASLSRSGRVREADPRRLGVHAAIANASAGTALPIYIERDFDQRIQKHLVEYVRCGGFLLLVGGSSVGKTRTLYEAVRTVVPDWLLVRPEPGDGLGGQLGSLPPRTVVWLDELQRFLTGPHRLTVSTVRAALDTGAIVVATLWPGEYHPRMIDPAAERGDGLEFDRMLLELAEVIDVPDELTEAERRHATDLADHDARIRTALETPDYGVTQILAAAPALVRAWLHAPDAYSRAVITAAVDACRLGWLSPLPRRLLSDLVPAYLSPHERARAPLDWLDRALDYASTVLLGATCVLNPVAESIGDVNGYVVADYVLQHGRRTRRSERLPVGAWKALIAHADELSDAERLADSAEARGLYRYAESLLERCAAAWTIWSPVVGRLAAIYERQGRIDDAISLAATKRDGEALWAISEILERAGQPERAIAILEAADLPDPYLDWRLAKAHAMIGNIDRALTLLGPIMTDCDDDPDMRVDTLRADLLVKAGRIDQLRARTLDMEDWCAGTRLVRYYCEKQEYDAALELIIELDRHEQVWADTFVQVLAESGRLDDVAGCLLLEDPIDRRYAPFYWNASPGLAARLLIQHGATDLVRRWADEGLAHASEALAQHLADTNQHDELQQRAASGDPAAVERYSQLLADRGDPHAALTLYDEHECTDPWHRAELLAQIGELDDGLALLRSLPDPAAAALRMVGADRDHRILKFSARHGRLDEIRQHAHDGDWLAEELLTETLAQQGQLAELCTEVDAGTQSAVEQLSAALDAQGRTAQAQQLRAGGLDDRGAASFVGL